MRSKLRMFPVLMLLMASLPVIAQSADPAAPSMPLRDRFYYGGSVGASFGDVDYLLIAPNLGFRVTPKFSTGVGVSYIYRSYSGPSGFSTDDYGLDVYGRYRIIPQLFAQLQYSHSRFEYPLLAGGTADDSYSAVLAGGGWVQPLGRRASFIVSALYDFSYDEGKPAPYDDPWVVSAGVSFGF